MTPDDPALIERWLHGETLPGDAEVVRRRLVEDAVFAKSMLRAADEIRLLRNAQRAVGTSNRLMRQVQGGAVRPVAKPRWWLGAAAAMAASVAILLAVVLRPWAPDAAAGPAAIAVVESVRGTSRWQSGQGLPPGAQVDAQDGAIAIRMHQDGSRLVLTDGSITLPSAGRPSAYGLASGRLAVAAGHHPADAPMTIGTAYGPVAVVGTRFLIDATSDRTWLSVDEGQVRFGGRLIAAGGMVQADGSGVRSCCEAWTPDMPAPPVVGAGVRMEERGIVVDGSQALRQLRLVAPRPGRHGALVRVRLQLQSGTLAITSHAEGERSVGGVWRDGTWELSGRVSARTWTASTAASTAACPPGWVDAIVSSDAASVRTILVRPGAAPAMISLSASAWNGTTPAMEPAVSLEIEGGTVRIGGWWVLAPSP